MASSDQWQVPESGIEEDRLSYLPEGIIAHILSFLETKYAVGTVVLSRQWTGLWTRVSTLDFKSYLVYEELRNYQGYDSPEKQAIRARKDLEFSRFVDKVLTQHKNLDSIWCFRLHCHAQVRPDDMFERALVFGSQIEEIDVMILEAREVGVSPRLPESFYTLKNLKVANLYEVRMTVNGSFSLPSLKILELWKVQTKDLECLSKLISGCPVLETLCLQYCTVVVDINEEDVLTASMPSLRDLIISFDNDDKCAFPIVIKAPKLENLVLKNFTEIQFLGGSSSSSSPLSCLHAARLFTSHRASRGSSYHRWIRLLTQIANAKELNLSRSTLDFLASGGKQVQMPVFSNLTHLEVKPGARSGILHSLLRSASNLRYLVINVAMVDGLMMWEETERPSTPECFRSSLEEIEINDFVLDQNDMKMVGYLLNAGAVLKKVDIHALGCDYDECKELKSLLKKLPRGSTACDICVLLRGSEIDSV